MSDSPPDAVRSVEHLIELMAELRETLRRTEASLRQALEMIEGGSDIATAVLATKPTATRNDINGALKDVERARHDMRIQIFASALDRGISIAELGRLFGFSRQLAARYAKEARADA